METERGHFSIAEFDFRMEVRNGSHCQSHQQCWICSCIGEERKLALYGNLVPTQYFVPVAKKIFIIMYLLFIIFICKKILSNSLNINRNIIIVIVINLLISIFIFIIVPMCIIIYIYIINNCSIYCSYV